MAGVPERIGALKSLVMSGFEPGPSAWQASALSIALCHFDRERRHKKDKF